MHVGARDVMWCAHIQDTDTSIEGDDVAMKSSPRDFAMAHHQQFGSYSE